MKEQNEPPIRDGGEAQRKMGDSDWNLLPSEVAAAVRKWCIEHDFVGDDGHISYTWANCAVVAINSFLAAAPNVESVAPDGAKLDESPERPLDPYYVLGRCLPLIDILIHEGSGETQRLAKGVRSEILAASPAPSVAVPQPVNQEWIESLLQVVRDYRQTAHRKRLPTDPTRPPCDICSRADELLAAAPVAKSVTPQGRDA
jgi:hypothetical protein